VHERCKRYEGYYDVNLVKQLHPEVCRVVFGDNTLRKGNGGQACIRDTPASFGVATKLLPSQMDNSFFEDGNEEHKQFIEDDLQELENLLKKNTTLVVYFPEYGLGTGLSEMPTKCPHLFMHMNKLIKEKFGIDYMQFHSQIGDNNAGTNNI
jgi:hypothetical protein